MSQASFFLKHAVLVLAVFAALAVAVLSLAPPAEIASAPMPNDKLRHFVAYAVLGLLFAEALPARPLWMIVLGLGVYGAGLELAQALTAYGREASLLDGAANVAGTFCGALVLRMARSGSGLLGRDG